VDPEPVFSLNCCPSTKVRKVLESGKELRSTIGIAAVIHHIGPEEDIGSPDRLGQAEG
jgi:hypothetical protein